MKQNKYRYFSVVLVDGSECEIKCNNYPITEEYCKRDAWHYVNKQYGLNLRPTDVWSVKGVIK